MEAELLDARGVPIPLAGITELRIRFYLSATPTDHVATVVNPATAAVRYDWQTADTANAGEYRLEWLIDRGGRIQKVPGDGWDTLVVIADP